MEKAKFIISVIVVALVVGFVLIILIGGVASCATETDYMTMQSVYRDGYVMVDEQTGVMYFKERGMGGITALLNADGTPMIWRGQE